jgi:hypothetical protein
MRRLKLDAIYNQKDNGKWDCHIEEAPHICVIDASDLDTARVLLEIITAEEVELWTRKRQHFEIVREEIRYYQNQ